MNLPDRLNLRWLSSLSPGKVALLVAFCSVAALLAFWQIVPSDSQSNENSDYLNYYEPVAQNLLAGKGLVTNSGQPGTLYPPAYPLLLATAFKLASWFSLSAATANLALTLVSHLLAAVFISLLARKLWSNAGALIAALAWISYPPILWLTKQPNSEIPFMAVFYGSVWLLWTACWRRAKWHFFVLAGMLGGIAALLRPIGLGAMVMMSLGLLLATRGKEFRLRLAMVAFLVVGNLLAIFPWQVWVYTRTGKVVMLSGNLVPSIRDGLRFAVNLKRYRQAVPVPDDVRAMMQRIDARFDEMNSLANVAKVVRDVASPQPMALVKLMLIKAARSWYATDSGRREGLILLFQIVYLGLVAIGGWRAWKSGGQARELFFGLALTLLYFWGMTVLTLSILRYMTPVIGLAFTVLGALATSTVRRKENATSPGIPGVMHLTDTLDSGGAERMAVNLVNHLPRDQYRVHLCTTRRDGALSDFVAADVERLRLERKGRFDLRAIFKLRRYIAEREIQLLHAHNTSLFIALAVAAFPPFPAVIWHHHTGRYAMEDRAARIYQLIAGRIRSVITVNQELAEWTRRRLGIPADRVRYIPNFVGENSPQPPIELPGKSGKRIVCVANLHPDKDHATLFRAMRQVIQQVPDAQLLLAGQARDAHYLQTVTIEMVKLGLTKNVTLLGQQKNIPQLLSACDIGVLSSVSEGLPMALLEYGMVGLAVAATDVGQCAEVLEFGNAGVIVPKSDSDKLAEALVLLLESVELRRTLGEKLQSRVRERYSVNAVMKEVCRMYEEVLNHKSAQIISEH